jgi:hypothetical protein
MNVALILVSLGIANAPEPIGRLMLAYFDDMTSCVAAVKQAELPVAGTPGRSLNTWAQFVCVPVPTKGSTSFGLAISLARRGRSSRPRSSIGRGLG